MIVRKIVTILLLSFAAGILPKAQAKNTSIIPKPMPKTVNFSVSMDRQFSKKTSLNYEKTLKTFGFQKIPKGFIKVQGLPMDNSYWSQSNERLILLNSYELGLRRGQIYTLPNKGFLYYSKKNENQRPILAYFEGTSLHKVSQLIGNMFPQSLAAKNIVLKASSRNIANFEVKETESNAQPRAPIDYSSPMPDKLNELELAFKNIEGCLSLLHYQRFLDFYENIYARPVREFATALLTPAESLNTAGQQIERFANNFRPFVVAFYASIGKKFTDFPGLRPEKKGAFLCQTILTYVLGKNAMGSAGTSSKQALDSAIDKVSQRSGKGPLPALFSGGPTLENLYNSLFPLFRGKALSQVKAAGPLKGDQKRLAEDWWKFKKNTTFHTEPFTLIKPKIQGRGGVSLVSTTGTQMGAFKVVFRPRSPIYVEFRAKSFFQNPGNLRGHIESQVEQALAATRLRVGNKYKPNSMIFDADPIPAAASRIWSGTPFDKDFGGVSITLRGSKNDFVFLEELGKAQSRPPTYSRADSITPQIQN